MSGEDHPPRHVDTQDAIFLAVGRAMAAWEQLETRICFLFGSLKGLKEGVDTPAIVALYSARDSVDARLRTVRSALEVFCVDRPCQKFEGDVVKLLEKILAAKNDRNDIAHGHLFSEATLILDYGAQFYYEGAHLVPARWKPKAEFHYSSLDINAITSRFDDLRSEVRCLTTRCAELRTSI